MQLFYARGQTICSFLVLMHGCNMQLYLELNSFTSIFIIDTEQQFLEYILIAGQVFLEGNGCFPKRADKIDSSSYDS